MQKGRFYVYSVFILVIGLLSLTTLDWVNEAFFRAGFSYPSPRIPQWSLPGEQFTDGRTPPLRQKGR